jgi:trehalose 6-phosphate synthase
MYAINTPAPERRRRMKALRRRVADHDVQRWAERYLEALAIAPRKPQRQQRQQEQAEQAGARQDLANRAVADLASEFVQP